MTEKGYEAYRLEEGTSERYDAPRRAPPRRPAGQRRPTSRHPAETSQLPRERFLRLDRYRVDREWKRYEGTPQRDLFRELRIRFLERHRARGRWSVDVGSGPGRFSPLVGESGGRAVQLDLSREMLSFARDRAGARSGRRPLDLVRGDVLRAPLRPGKFAEVAVLGNGLGFAGEASDRFLDAAIGLVAPGGTLL
ncbi:MAG TPA: methyltransferase domain-containing protein, partial [Thermoplasmata archaeon]